MRPMLDVIEKMLVLQDRDQHILRQQAELDRIEPELRSLSNKVDAAQKTLEGAKQRAHQIESERKKLELEVEAKKTLIEKYSLQQFQTKKNDEYKALTREIENCEAAITELEDRELELMVQYDDAVTRVQAAQRESQVAAEEAASQTADLDARAKGLSEEVERLRRDRGSLASELPGGTRRKYERLSQHRAGKVVVGIDRRVCGGCHMKLPAQMVLACRAGHDVVYCTNCGRIIYYTRDMVLTGEGA